MEILAVVVDQLPANCLECVDETCNLPLSMKGNCRVLKNYQKKRHPSCPMVTVEEFFKKHVKWGADLAKD